MIPPDQVNNFLILSNSCNAIIIIFSLVNYPSYNYFIGQGMFRISTFTNLSTHLTCFTSDSPPVTTVLLLGIPPLEAT